MSRDSGWLRVLRSKRNAKSDTQVIQHGESTLFDWLENLLFNVTGNRTDIDRSLTKLDEVELKADEALLLAKGGNKALVFDTEAQMFEELKKVENKGKYPIGTNIYLVEIGPTDRWVKDQLEEPNSEGFYYEISELETEKIDLTDLNNTMSYVLRALCREEFSSEATYQKGDIVRYEYVLYQSLIDNNVGAFSLDNWGEIDVATLIERILENLDDVTTADEPLEGEETQVIPRDADTLGGRYTADDISGLIYSNSKGLSSVTNFLENGDIKTTYSDGSVELTTFGEDGSITTTYTDKNGELLNTVIVVFAEDGSIITTVKAEV